MAKTPTWAKQIMAAQMGSEKNILDVLEQEYMRALNDSQQVLQALYDRVKTEGLTPSLVGQINYQNALTKQIEGIYNDLYGNAYTKVHDYLKDCYEDGILQSMYSLHQDGLDICIPIDQNEIALMAGKSASSGFKLSKNLYINTFEMAKMVRSEITRGIIAQESYDDIARNLALRSGQEFNRTMRIARTEGHRVRMESHMQSMHKAKEKGADVVKQWDSTLDGRTRPTHRALDGEIRELDGKFKSNGNEAYYPGGFGVAKEDINCRCVLLERARWALDKDDNVTKWDGTNGELLKNQQEIETWKKVNQWTSGKDKGNHYNQFKKSYKQAAKQAAATTPKTPKLTKKQQQEIQKLEQDKLDLENQLQAFDDQKEYKNIWKDPVTIKDWKDKKGSIQAKEDYFTMKGYAATSSAEKHKFSNLIDELWEFDGEGEKYWKIKDQIEDLENQINAINPLAKSKAKSALYTPMTPSGGSLNTNCTYKKLFGTKEDADKHFRNWADKTTYALKDNDGQMALYHYTAGSGHMNRPLSGYDSDWYRSQFKGLGKVSWNNEHSEGKKRIEALTKLIDNTQPLTEGVVLRRGSDNDGLIGLFEGAGFDYDTIKKACADGSIVKMQGSVVKNHAFTSCGIADGAGFGGEVEYIIKCPAGTKMVYAEPQSYYGKTISRGQLYTPGMSYSRVGSEAEMLLQRGTAFRIDEIEKSGYRYKVEMTVVDQKY